MRTDMPSFVFDSFFLDAVNGQINLGSDTFRCLLATSAYQPHKASHRRRSDILGEVTEGSGYIRGGFGVDLSASMSAGTLYVQLGGFTIRNATISARFACYYKSRGGDSAADSAILKVQNWHL
jgi:hypothetical protein